MLNKKLLLHKFIQKGKVLKDAEKSKILKDLFLRGLNRFPPDYIHFSRVGYQTTVPCLTSAFLGNFQTFAMAASGCSLKHDVGVWSLSEPPS